MVAPSKTHISWTDSHAHITMPPLLENVEKIILGAKNEHVDKIVNICCDLSALEEGIKVADKHPHVFLVASASPHDVEKELSPLNTLIEECARKKKLIAIGETGLDYYYQHTSREKQQEALINYCRMAKEFNLPLVIHCRDAFDDLFSILDFHFSQGKVLLHCFTGSCEEATNALDRGWYISFSGIVTFKKSLGLNEVLQLVPNDRLLIETDSPYLSPEGKRGKINEPANVAIIAKYIADKKEIPLEGFSAILEKNFLTLFL